MNFSIYTKEAFPKPLDKHGEVTTVPYSVTLPNTAYLKDIAKYIPAYNSETMVICTLQAIPEYPILVDDVVIAGTINDYKLAGLVELEEHEVELNGEIVFTAEYQATLDATNLYQAKKAKVNEMEALKDSLRETKSVTFTKDGVDYLHGIREKDYNNVTGAITIMNESPNPDTASTIWAFKDAKSTVLTKADMVVLINAIRNTVNEIYTNRASIIEDLTELTTIEEVKAYDVSALMN